MDGHGDAIADAKLRIGGRKDENFREIDIVNSVMGRVRTLANGSTVSKSPFRMARTAALTTAGSLLLFGSVAGYAASEYVKLKDSRGRVVIETMQASDNEMPKDIGRRMAEYRDRVRAALKQDQMLAYYVKDDKVNAYDKLNLIKFESKLEYDTYAAYASEMTRTSAPSLAWPEGLPKGYEFEIGRLEPRPPLQGDSGSEYEELKGRLMTAAASSDESDILFMEPVRWKSILTSYMRFSNGSSMIQLMATRGPDNPGKLGGRSILYQRTTERTETVKLTESQQAVYKRDEGEQASAIQSLIWYDEQSNIYYDAFADNTVSREELMRIGKGIVQATKER